MANAFKAILIGFITILITIILIQSLADNESALRTLDTISNDVFVSSNTSCVQITSGCIDSITSVKNTTTTLAATNYTLCESSSGNNDGIKLTSGYPQYSGNDLNATYTQSVGCTYVTNATSRTLTPLVILFFAMAILFAALYYLKETGLFDQG